MEESVIKLVTTIIVIVGIVQGLFIGLALALDKIYATRNNRFVGICLLLFSVQGVLDLISYRGLSGRYVWAEIATSFGLQGIILVPYFILILESTKSKFFLPKVTLFIPFILSMIYGLFATALILLGIKDLYWNQLWLDEFWTFHWYLNMLFIIVMNAYLYRLVKRISSANEQRGPYTLWRSFSILIVLWATLQLLGLFYSSELYFTVFWGSFTLFIFWLTYIGIVRQRLNDEQKSLHFILKMTETPKPKREASSNNYYDAFIQLMEEESIYRDAELSRDKVAKRLGISSGYFSTVLGQSSTQSFNEILNEYRVKEVTKILANGSLDHFSLTAIGLEVGYKSKSAFFNNFKKITGLSPSAYKKKYQS